MKQATFTDLLEVTFRYGIIESLRHNSNTTTCWLI